MRIRCNFNSKCYKEKPTRLDIVSCELSKPVEIELADLANRLGDGANCRAAEVAGRTKDKFVSQQIFMVDIDNAKKNPVTGEKEPLPAGQLLSPYGAMTMANEAGLKPCFLYETHSSTDDLKRFRIAFVADRIVDDVRERNAIQRKIMDVYPTCDQSCESAEKIFLGGHKGLLYKDFEAVNKVSDLLKGVDLSAYATEPPKKEKKKTRAKTSGHASGNQPDMFNVELIRAHDAERLRERLSVEPRTFDTKKDLMTDIYRLSLADLLGVKEHDSFCCLFHTDTHPSASVFRDSRYGTWRYKCHAEGLNLNFKQVIERTGNFKSEYAGLRFIMDVYGLSVKETEWSREQTENIDRILAVLSGANGESFSEICPTASKTTRNAIQTFEHVLMIAKSTIYPEKSSSGNDVLFYMSDRQLARSLGKQPSQVHRYLKMLIYHRMLEIVPDENVPRKMLSSALKSREQGHNHISFYSIPSWVFARTAMIEAQGVKWREFGYRVKAVSYDLFFRTEGPEVAGRLFPQTAKQPTANGEVRTRKPTKKAEWAHGELQKVVLGLILDQGYATEKQVIERMHEGGMGREKADYRLKQGLADIMQCNNLVRIRATNELKLRYGIDIPEKSHPYIIIREG